jgi:hypothetical protein
VATAALTVVVVPLLTVTVQADGSALQLPQAVEVLDVFVGSALQVPQVEVLEELDLPGSALQLPHVELPEELLAEAVGSALHTLHVPVVVPPKPSPLVAVLQVELVQVPKPLPKV